MKFAKGEIYCVLDLGGKDIKDDIGGNLVFSCTNKRIVERNTGIAYHRMVYVFTKLKRNVLMEKGYLILRSRNHYKGKQLGGIRNKKLFIRGNS